MMTCDLVVNLHKQCSAHCEHEAQYSHRITYFLFVHTCMTHMNNKKYLTHIGMYCA